MKQQVLERHTEQLARLNDAFAVDLDDDDAAQWRLRGAQRGYLYTFLAEPEGVDTAFTIEVRYVSGPNGDDYSWSLIAGDRDVTPDDAEAKGYDDPVKAAGAARAAFTDIFDDLRRQMGVIEA